MIRDQRHMQGPRPLDSPADVRAFWQLWAVRKGFVGRHLPDGRPARDVAEEGRTAPAYISDSRWVADCSYCSGGMAAWPDHTFACCLDCGHVHAIEFPDDATLRAAVRVLLARPERARNWKPWVESVDQLRRENQERGVK